MKKISKIVMMMALSLLVRGAMAAPWMGYLLVNDPVVWPNGSLGNYETVKYFIDEDEGDTIPMDVYVELWPDGNSVNSIEVQTFSNLNRRDFAKTFENPNDAGQTNSYWMTYNMSYVGNSSARPQHYLYKTTVNVNKTGAYRLTTRFRINGGAWQWLNSFGFSGQNQRDLAVVVSPKKVQTLSIYEVNSLVVEATPGGTVNQRSTFEDFTDRDNDGYDPFNLDYVKNTLGFNTMWLMPIFPITEWRWDPVYWNWAANHSPGSPYATRDYWSVNEKLSASNSQSAAIAEFQYMVSEAEELGLNIFIDMALNHAGRDVKYGQGAVDLGLCQPWEKDYWIRESRSAWLTKWSNPNTCELNYRQHAGNSYEAALYSPADRLGEHQWWDANADFFFGSYSSLGAKPGYCYDYQGGALDERDLFYTDLDPAGGHDYEVQNVFEYFSYLIPYWLQVTSNQLDGIRADFAQGLPPQAWEYIINKTRAQKWDFVFLAEVLDPTEVIYRANRQFDVMTTVDHYLYRHNDATMSQYFNSQEGESGIYGYNASMMHNGTSHDEDGNGNKWLMAARYAVSAASYGVPMAFMGQPLGIQHKINFQTAWAEISGVWSNADSSVADMYRKINVAREENPALQDTKRYYLSKKSNGQFNQDVFSIARWTGSGSSANIVLAFVNLRDWVISSDTFAIPSAVSIDPSKTYQCYNLTGNPSTALWGSGRTGADILANGVWVGFNYANEVQFLKLVAIN